MFGDRDLTGALGENSNILRRISRLSTVSVVRVKRDGRSMRVLTTSDGVPFYVRYISRACPKRNRVPAGIQSYSGLLCDSKPHHGFIAKKSETGVFVLLLGEGVAGAW